MQDISLLFEPETNKNVSYNVFEDIKDTVTAIYKTINEDAKKLQVAAVLVSCFEAPLMANHLDINTTMECTATVLNAEYIESCSQKLQGFLDLEENWDGEGAAAINPDAVKNGQSLLSSFPYELKLLGLSVFPTELGAVGFKYTTTKGVLRLEMGDNVFSYFVRRKGEKTKHYSFVEYNADNISNLVMDFVNLA